MPISGREATLLSIVADYPESYTVESFQETFRDAGSQVVDIVAAIVGDEEHLEGKPDDERERIEKTADALKKSAAANQEYWRKLANGK